MANDIFLGICTTLGVVAVVWFFRSIRGSDMRDIAPLVAEEQRRRLYEDGYKERKF
jgi:hypothetical protein